MKTGEVYIAVKWHNRSFTRVENETLKSIFPIKSFCRFKQACKKSLLILRFTAFYYLSDLERIKKGKPRSDVFRRKTHSGSFLTFFSLAATECTCSVF